MKFDGILPSEFHFNQLRKTKVQPGATPFDHLKMDAELVEGLELICSQEGLTMEELDCCFHSMQVRTEQQIKYGQSIQNHLTVLNQQLRAAAAVFLLVICSSFAVANNLQTGGMSDWGALTGPYELADGMKIVP